MSLPLKIKIIRDNFCIGSVFIAGISALLVVDSFLFNYSKPSFLNGLDMRIQFLHLLEGVYLLNYIFGIPLILLIAFLGLIPIRFCSVVGRRSIVLLSAVFLSVAIFLITEKMLYSFFSISILESQSSKRAGFVAFFMLTLYLSHVWISRQYTKLISGSFRPLLRIASLAISVCLLFGVGSVAAAFMSNQASEKAYPNIIFVSGDGIRAENTSVYGYRKPTTPFLDSIKDRTLFVQNAYANNAWTGGSLLSVLTGMNPATTKVFNVGANLQEKDAKRSLPAILKSIGYRTYLAQNRLSAPLIWTDLTRRNMRGAFDYPNDPQLTIKSLIPKAHLSLMRDLLGNAIPKLGHLFHLQNSKKPFSAVTSPSTLAVDESTLEEAIRVIRHSKEPYFLQLHLIGPHGPLFETKSKQFSDGQFQNRPGQSAFYNDAILDFDSHVKKLYEEVSRLGDADNVIWVIFSDHGRAHKVTESVPLMFYFPNQLHKGSFRKIAQLTDIAPTILDYLGLDVPEWMDGDSLLDEEFPSRRPVYTFFTEELRKKSLPSIGSAFRIQCDHLVQIDYIERSLESKFIKSDQVDCRSDQSDIKQSYLSLLEYLQSKELKIDHSEIQSFKGYEALQK